MSPKKKKPTTIGITGSGTLSKRMLVSLLDDYAAANGGIEVLFAFPTEPTTEQLDILAWADKGGVAVGGIVPNEKAVADANDADHPLANVAVTTPDTDVVADLIEELKDSDGKLFILWDDDDDDAYRALELALEADLEAFDLCNGMEKLVFDEEGEEEETPEEEPEPEADEETEKLLNRSALLRHTAKELKAMLDERDVTVSREGKGRITKDAYVAAMIGFEETGAQYFLQDAEHGAVPVGGPSAPPPEEDEDEDEDAVAEAEAELEAELEAEADDWNGPLDLDDEEDYVGPTDVDPETGEIDPVDIPEDDDPQKNVVADPLPPDWQLVAHCLGCGGPVFARKVYAQARAPKVSWSHTKACPIK